MKYLRKNAVTIFLSLLTAVTLLCGVILFFNPQKTYAIADTSASAVVTVDELTLTDYETRSDKKVFDSANLSVLYEYLTGEEGATLDTVKAKVSGTQAYGNSTVAKMLTSADINKNVGALTGTARDIVVSFGGYEWTVTSLTTDENGDPIVTLWLAESDETSVWQNYTVTTSTTYGTYPPNMYATSYIRTVTLNAGGYYGLDNTNLTEASQDDTSKWAKFTMTEVEGSLTSFIDTPSQVKYQEVESWPLQVIDHSDYTGTTYYYLKSDSYGTPDGKYGSWYSSESTSNYATYTKAGAYYDNWKNDYLWLPSLTETGREYASSTNLAVTGIWEASANQKANSDTSWLRSGGNYCAYSAIYLTAAGSNSDTVASTAYCVRPALHLNLAAAAKNVGSDVSVTVDELTLSGYAARTDGAVFNSANLSTLYQYLTGVEGATYADVASLVQGQTQEYGNSTIAKMLTSADISANVGTLTGSARDIIVSFGGYDWTVTSLTTDENGDPIVTLWLAESDETSVWQNYTVTASTDYGDYPPNMYGTSYMRVVTLNAGGSYATSNAAVTSYAQSSSSQWAKFTMSNAMGSLTQFIDTPSQVKYQEIESWPLQVIDHSDYKGTTFYYLKNDSYGTPDGKYGSWSDGDSVSDYATYTTANVYYDNWKSDYLWLPSLTETGTEYVSSTNLAVTGIWETSASQKVNSDSSWLRTGAVSNAYLVNNLTAVGSYINGAVASTAYAVRPALHLNLASAETNTKVNAQVTVNGATTDYYSVESAFTAANAATTTADSRATIKLLIDCTTTATLTVESGSFVTLDLNGRALKTTGDNSVITVYGDLILNDSDPTTEHKFTVSESGLWVLDETNGTKTVKGGVITGGTGSNKTDIEDKSLTYGGGVFINGGNFTMNGGNVVGNSSSQDGGGVYAAYGGTFHLNDGVICGNFSSYGAGVYLYSPSSAYMKGGSIRNNTAAGNGGGIFLHCTVYAELSGGKIVENKAGNAGGGIYLRERTDADHLLYISGNPIVADNLRNDDASTPSNIYLDRENKLYFVTSLQEGAKFGITYAPEYSGAFTSGYSTYNNSVAPSTYFFADSGQVVCLDAGEAIVTDEHNYDTENISWTWSEDGKSATATFTCTVCGDEHVETATISSEETTAATCEEKGTTTYTATVTFNGTYSSTKEVQDIPALGHDYQAVVTAPTCTEQGYTTYTCTHDATHSYVADYTDATGHAYGEPVWTWNGTAGASATFTCANDPLHTVTETATVASEVTTAATCETAGVKTYTATVTFNGQTYTDTKTESISALGHDYQAVVTAPTCTEQGYTTYTCTHDGSHTYTSDIVPATGHQWNDGVITTEATCETAGVKTYTCAVCGDTNTETIPALGHAYGEPVWTWSADGTLATATFTCEHDGTHVVTETAVITEEITTQPTTETTGIKTITATVTFNGQTYTDTKTEEIAKLVSDEGGKGDVSDLPPLTDPDSEYELEITVKATDKQYNFPGVNKGYLIELWIVNGDNKTAYNQNKTVTLSLVIPEGMEEFTLYRLANGAFDPVSENDYTVEGGILTIRTTLSAEFVFHTDKTDEGSASSGGMAWYWWLIIALIVVAIIVIILIIILKKRRKKGDPEKTTETVVQVEKYDDAELKQRLNAQQKQIDELLNRDDDGFNDIVDDDK